MHYLLSCITVLTKDYGIKTKFLTIKLIKYPRLSLTNFQINKQNTKLNYFLIILQHFVSPAINNQQLHSLQTYRSIAPSYGSLSMCSP